MAMLSPATTTGRRTTASRSRIATCVTRYRIHGIPATGHCHNLNGGSSSVPAGVRLTKFSTFAPAVLVCAVLAASAQAAQSPTIKVLSGRADLASGGDALVAIELPPGVSASSVRVTVGGRNVTGRFAKRANGRYEGLLSGLANGPNVVTARVAGGGGAGITIVGHPTGGPVFSGPQVKPWKCTSAAARDAKCNQPTKYSYQYRS